MWTASNNRDYAATYRGNTMQFFYQKQLQCELAVKSYTHARKLLSDWARLNIPPDQVQHYQALIERYVGATVSDADIPIRNGGQYYIRINDNSAAAI